LCKGLRKKRGIERKQKNEEERRRVKSLNKEKLTLVRPIPRFEKSKIRQYGSGVKHGQNLAHPAAPAQPFNETHVKKRKKKKKK